MPTKLKAATLPFDYAICVGGRVKRAEDLSPNDEVILVCHEGDHVWRKPTEADVSPAKKPTRARPRPEWTLANKGKEGD